MFKNNVAVIALPDKTMYPATQRKQDLELTGIDIEDAILSVLKSLTATQPTIDPLEVHQELFELAQDHSWGKRYVSTPVAHGTDLNSITTTRTYHFGQGQQINQVELSSDVKQALQRLLLDAESFLAPHLPKLRRIGSPVAIEGFKRFPNIAVFNFITLEKPNAPENDEIKEGLDIFIDELRKDKLSTAIEDKMLERVHSGWIPKPVPDLTTDLHIDRIVRDYIFSLAGTFETMQDEQNYKLELCVKLKLLHKASSEGLNYSEVVRFFNITKYTSNSTLLEDATLWYKSLNRVLKQIELTSNSFRDITVKNIFEHLYSGLRALYMGKVYSEPRLYGNASTSEALHQLFCKTLLDGESELFFNHYLSNTGRLMSTPFLEVLPEALLDREKLTASYLYAYRYDSVGDVNLSHGGLVGNRPLYFALSKDDWSSPHLRGLYAQKRTLLIFKVSNPKILLGQATQLEYWMNDEHFLADCKDNDAIFYTHVSDGSSNQGVLLTPRHNNVEIISIPDKLIQEYFDNLHRPLSVPQSIVSEQYCQMGQILKF